MDGESGSYDILEAKLLQPGATPIFLPLKFLKVITHHFSDERVLGRGGYGVVYKGILQNGTVIAVKKLLETQLIQDKQFQNEVSYFMGIKHRNIVQFVGYCAVSEWQIVEFNGKYVFAELPERLLCFEFLSKGSLDKHLSVESCGLDWSMRYEIIKGICQGLHYLHSECHIIHLDLKPANILMDDNMTPKIADFGLSRLFGEEQSRFITASRKGSLGYMSPEYLDKGIISYESDIFSLGVIIVEIITGVRKYPMGTESPQDFIEKVLRSWRNRFERVARCASLAIDCQQIKRCIEMGLRCLETKPEKRLTTVDIVDIFNRSMDWSVSNDVLSSTDQIVSSRIKIVFKKLFTSVESVDLHPIEPWILLSQYSGSVHIWNYQTQELVISSRVDHRPVYSAKFIARNQWFVAGGGDAFIHVYSYNTKDKVKDFRAHRRGIRSLAIHPTQPYVLSSSYDYLIKLWDWEKGWKCTRIFEGHSNIVCQVTFNQLDPHTFASASWDRTAKIWSLLGSPRPFFTWDGHSEFLQSVNFYTDGRPFLITGYMDGAVKVCDYSGRDIEGTILEGTILEGHTDSVTAVCCHPELPILITGSQDGIVRLWSSTTFRLKETLNFGFRQVRALAYLKGSRRVVIAHEDGLVMIEIGDEEPVADMDTQ